MTRKPIVVHVLEAVGGGTSRHLVNLVRNTPDVEHHVVIPAKRVGWVTDEGAANQLRAAGATVTMIDMRRNPLSPVNAIAAARLTLLCRRLKPDVLHGHSSMGGALARLVPSKAQRVYTPNGIHPSGAAIPFERILGRFTDYLVAVSESEAELSRRHGLTPEENLLTIPNGIDLSPLPRIDLHRELGLPTSTPLVGTIARVSSQKAPERFLAVAERVREVHPDVVFVLIGDGPDAAEIDAAAASLGESYRRIPVMADAAQGLASLDVFCLFSRYEGAPYAPLEAALAGAPLVLSDVVGNRDVIEDERSGLLVEENDIAGAAEAVIRLLEEPLLRHRLISGMRSRLAQHFDVRLQGDRHSVLYHRLAGLVMPTVELSHAEAQVAVNS